MQTARLAAVGLAAAVLAAGTLRAGAAPLSVFVSVLPLQAFVERVGGERVEVSVMVAPGQSPATYEPLPRQMRGLSGAVLYFRVGVPFEAAWMERLRQINPAMRVVDLRRDLNLAEAGIDPGALGPAADPHVWTSPPLVRRMAATLRDALARADPDGREAYEEGYRRFTAELDALHAELRERLAPVRGQGFLVYHPAWSYFAATYGLEQWAIEAAGKAPGPRDLAGVLERARRAGVRAVFVQPQFDAAPARTVARALEAAVIELDPLSPDYLTTMRGAARAIRGAIEQR